MIRLLALGALPLLLVTNWYVYHAVAAPAVLTVETLPVAKGQAILIKGPTGSTVLIDGGPDAAILRILGDTLPFGDRTIDAIIETYPNANYIGGLPEVLARYRVMHFFDTGVPGTTRVAASLESAVSQKGIPRTTLTRGMRLDLGSGAYADVLYPDRDASAMDSAHAAPLLRVVYGHTSILITGTLLPSLVHYVTGLESTSFAPDLTIASNTPAGVFHSDGRLIRTY